MWYVSGRDLRSMIALLVLLLVLDMSESLLMIVGLNPALQRSVSFVNDIMKGSVNRGADMSVGIGGKGQNCYVACNILNSNAKESNLSLDLVQFIGSGLEGEQLLSLLSNNHALTETSLTVRSVSRLRTCITLVDPSDATEIIEPSGPITEEEQLELLHAVSKRLNKAKGIACMGSMPPGVSKDFYIELIRSGSTTTTKVLLDTNVNIANTLNMCQKDIKCPSMLKINARELCALVGIEAASGSDVSEATSADAIQQSASLLQKELTDKQGAAVHLAITDGPHAAYLFNLQNQEAMKYTLPALAKSIRNPIGAGDATAGGTIYRWIQDDGCTPEEAFKFGLAIGAASCMSGLNSVFDINDVQQLYTGISTSAFRWSSE